MRTNVKCSTSGCVNKFTVHFSLPHIENATDSQPRCFTYIPVISFLLSVAHVNALLMCVFINLTLGFVICELLTDSCSLFLILASVGNGKWGRVGSPISGRNIIFVFRCFLFSFCGHQRTGLH